VYADLKALVASIRPGSVSYRRIEFLRGGLGALIGIGLAALSARFIPGGPESLPFIVAPMGASAVLLFAAQASPLAQPYSVLVGNIVSTLVGITAGKLIPEPALAPAVAVAVAIPLMMALRCVHPPGGACALFAAVPSAAVAEQGFAFALWPVGINTVVLLLIAALVNNMTGRPYPHVPPPPPPPAADQDPMPSDRVGVRLEDVRDAMNRLDQGLDVLPADVIALVREAEAHALDRRLGQLRVSQVMARQVRTVRATDSIYRARSLMEQHRLKALPVIDAERHVVGIITVYDLFNLELVDLDPVSKVMTSPVTTVTEDSPVARLVSLMTDSGLRNLPVIDDDQRLVGIVTRTELVTVLNRALIGSR
jgi:CBS domain-containing membrane protein